MAKLKLKGIIAGVGDIAKVGEKGTEVVLMVLNVSGYTDEFGEKKGRDQAWLLQAMGERIKTLAISKDMVNKKAEIEFYCESYCLESKEAGKDPFYVVNNNIKSLTLLT